MLRSAPKPGAPKLTVVKGAPAQMDLSAQGAAAIAVSKDRRPFRSVPDLEDPRELYTYVRSEPRDEDWANASEAFVKAILANNVNLGPEAPVEVRCATTVCEATGIAAEGAEPEALQRSWDSLRGTINNPLIAAHGLRYATAAFGSGHSLHAFTVYYQRTDQ
jgi:hypothetical protein